MSDSTWVTLHTACLGSNMKIKFLCRYFSHFNFSYFACNCRWKLIHEFPVPGNFKRGNLSMTITGQIFKCYIDIVFKDYPRHNRLAIPVIRHSNNLDIFNVIMIMQEFLDFER